MCLCVSTRVQRGVNALAYARFKHHSAIVDMLTATAVEVLRGDLNEWITHVVGILSKHNCSGV